MESANTLTTRSLEGRRIGPYKIGGRIGAGGMGEVYKARDTRLDRAVASKVLPPTVADDQRSRGRLERQARAVATLNHPNICTLHDVGNHEGIDFRHGTSRGRNARGSRGWIIFGLVPAYVRTGRIEDARRVFEGLKDRARTSTSLPSF